VKIKREKALALTPGERENRFQSVRRIEAIRPAERLNAGHPLSKGEGGGKGEQDHQKALTMMFMLNEDGASLR
jgi:hypothetical protein